ncbi:hypothetical protein CB0940_02052 [Cercospora beticola]|uniref:Uncharacterized protein n=1 Tax=Cercospora beticola TaxID=122368 RepID=A0A2G5I9Q5_CERBT|nr:hypothetical protein CB0940_02052 [Cercospora beticola]PIB01518.1 hypothetical protein CB0940_02052 [Cercospora beticola]WPA97522.1 hypothetical protein RHO25_002132 [Cercospora beticola]
MAPIRRYLRITKFSVLEVRIYLRKSSDASWLLSSRDNVLSRIITSIRPKVLPKLREENENARQNKGKGKKKRGIKDVVSEEDFEVAIFLKETKSKHSLLTKRKEFGDQREGRLRSNGKGLTGWLGGGAGGGEKREDAIDLEREGEGGGLAVRREEDEDDVVVLDDIPEFGKEGGRNGKKRKSVAGDEEDGEDEDAALFVSSSDEEFFATQRAQPRKKRRRREQEQTEEDEEADDAPAIGEGDDKKKLALDTNYDGFTIYGRILCLIVTRKGKEQPRAQALEQAAPVGGSQMMEKFIATQVAREEGLSDVEDD